jgi:Tol biopolymer transport system component
MVWLLAAGFAQAGDKILYSAVPYDTYKMNPDGSGNVLLEQNAEQMSYCPDGKHIVFSTWRWDDPIGNSELAVMDSDGTDIVRLTDDGYVIIGDSAPDCSSDNTIVWKRRGRHLTHLPEGQIPYHTIMTMDLDGSDWTPLFESTGIGDVSWLDGNIVFTKRDGANGYQIYTMKGNGDGVTKLTSFTSDHPWYVDGSQDGDYIVYSRPTSPMDSEIWIMEANGSNQTALTSDDHYNKSPHFDASGENICFISKRSGIYFQVFRMAANGSKQTKLTSNSFDAMECDWNWERYSPF